MEPNAVEKEAKLEGLLVSKSFDALTPDEKIFVLEELGSEERYHAMQKIDQALKKITVDVSPDPAIIRSLQHRMKRSASRSGIASMLGARFPAYATVLLIVLFSAVSWWAGRSRSKEMSRIVERVRIDTVYLTAKADTLYRDRIIYREVKVSSKPAQKVFKVAGNPTNEKPGEKAVGVNMKEQKELEMLLVSGSE